MIQVKTFTFGEIRENTYVLYDETNECVIIDPGCQTPREEERLSDFIEKSNLKPVLLLNTHGHFDHVMGNAFVVKKYGIPSWINKADMFILERTAEYCALYGIEAQNPPTPEHFFKDDEFIRFGNSVLQVLFTPGHSLGGVCFYAEKEKFLIAGDSIFAGSVGRVDLPGGDGQQLIDSLHTKILSLPNDVTLYCGHGPSTTVGQERAHNPYLQSNPIF